MNKPVVAAFDFDGTLTSSDSFLPFLRAVSGDLRYTQHMLSLSPVLLAFALGLVTNHRAKADVLAKFLSGKKTSQIAQLAQDFATGQLAGFIKSAALARLRWHQQQGHRCVIVSASLECYLLPWATTIGAAEVIGSRLVAVNDVYTGELDGANCYGTEKVRRLTALLGQRDDYTLYAYGDSRGDRELLALADFSYYRRMPGG